MLQFWCYFVWYGRRPTMITETIDFFNNIILLQIYPFNYILHYEISISEAFYMIVFLEIQSSWSVFPPGWSTICSMTIICNALTSQDYISIWHPGSTNREILCPVSGEDNIMGICKKQMIYINNILRKLSPFPYTKQHYTHYRIECLLQKEKIIIFFFFKIQIDNHRQTLCDFYNVR